MDFRNKLTTAAKNADSLICVGLDTDVERLPEHLGGDFEAALLFNEAIIESTADLVCAYKPNSAFYEAMGADGIRILKKTCEAIPEHIPVILDVKRGDISNTAAKYADYAYDYLGADAVTVNPYMGYDAIKPFIRPGKCVFVLCLTSNQSAHELQLLETPEGKVFELLARYVASWNTDDGIGVVAGATRPEYISRIREIVGGMPILVPGIGAQGGDIASVLSTCGGKPGETIINSSRGILYASDGTDFADAARSSLMELRNAVNEQR